MKKTESGNHPYFFLFLIGLLLLLSPLVIAADIPNLFFGLPVSFFYVFGVWTLIIVLAAMASSKKSGKDE